MDVCIVYLLPSVRYYIGFSIFAGRPLFACILSVSYCSITRRSEGLCVALLSDIIIIILIKHYAISI